MATRHTLTPEIRRRLKKPIGTLIKGSFKETIEKLKDLMEKENPPMLISVGDSVSKNLTRNGMFPKLSIVDDKVMRRRIQPIELAVDKTVHVMNPSGTITKEAITKIQESIEDNRRVKIVVDGEEDLLTLIAVVYAPENSFVVYGQPHEGIVVVKVTRQKKAEITKILEAMKLSKS